MTGLLRKSLKVLTYIFCAFIIASLLALTLGMVLLLYTVLDTSIEAGENVARVDWLPEASSRICWFKSNLSYAVEFDIPERDFLEWAASPEGKKRFHLGDIKPIVPNDRYPYWHYVSRYINYLTPERRREKNLPPEPPDDLKIVHNPRPDADASKGDPEPSFSDGIQQNACPRRGWMYEHSYGNGGGIWLVFDSDIGRVFYYHSPR